MAPTGRGRVVYRRELFGRLDGAARVTQISAPAGSGKTFLLRSWIRDAGLAERVAWVSVRNEEQAFWISVADALRRTSPGATLVRGLTRPAGAAHQPFLLEAVARDMLGDEAACAAAMERALDIAAPGGDVLPFLLHPAPALLERHRKGRTADGPLVSQVLGLLHGGKPGPMRHLYTKLDAHSRTEAVERARHLGLLAPPARKS